MPSVAYLAKNERKLEGILYHDTKCHLCLFVVVFTFDEVCIMMCAVC